MLFALRSAQLDRVRARRGAGAVRLRQLVGLCEQGAQEANDLQCERAESRQPINSAIGAG